MTRGKGMTRVEEDDKGERMTNVEVAWVLLKVSPKMETGQQLRSPFHPGWCTFDA
jgi:hypothetical protein